MAEEIKNEIMNDEELDNVVGGTYAELSKDVAFLKDLGLLDKNFHGNYDQMSLAVNGAVGNYKFQVIVNSSGENIVRHFNRHGQPRNSNRELMYKSLAEQVAGPDFDYKKYL